MDYVLKTEGLTKKYGKHTVVNRVNMHVRKGDIYGFIGRNGAGKTTFMRMVSGLALPAEGTMELFGSQELEQQRLRVGSLIEQPGLYRNMTARENMETVRRELGIPEKSAVDDMLEFVRLSGTGKKKGRGPKKAKAETQEKAEKAAAGKGVEEAPAEVVQTSLFAA